MTPHHAGVTVAIPTTLTNSGAEQTAISALKSLTCANVPGEVLMVANGPHRNLNHVRVDDPRLRIITSDTASAPEARNIALDQAAYDTVAFTDDFCTVPPAWISDHLSHLTHGTVSCGPVDVAVIGPITSYLNYQRFLHAPPLTSTTTRYLITANCAIRRSTLPPGPTFDDIHFNNAAEDADLGYRLRDAGHHLQWAPTTAVTHHLHEDITEVTERFTRYGRGNATLVQLHHRWQESAPNGHHWLDSILSGQYVDHRRFSELHEPDLANLFAILDLARTVSFLLGYFEVRGRALNTSIVEWDDTELDSRWRALIDRALGRVHDIEPAHSLARIGDPPTRPGPYPQLTTPLRDIITVYPDQPPGIAETLAADADRLTGWATHAWTALTPLLETHRPSTVDELATLARAVGIAAPDATHEMEQRNSQVRRTLAP